MTVLEVGPGLGALTLPLAEKADKLVAVELDKRMIEPLTEELMQGLLSMYGAAVTCVCFMGGDASTGEIENLARWVRTNFPELRTAWYSGRDTLPENFDIKVLDYVKIGPYIEALGGLKSRHTNQKLYRVLPDGRLIEQTI